MRVFVHAGLNKAASTSLQAYLARVRDGLADVGVIYPDLGADNHWRLATELMDGREGRSGYLTRLKAKQGSAGSLDVLASTIRRCRDDGHDCLLSHENFSAGERLRALGRHVASVDQSAQLIVFAYCREPVPLYQSSVQHTLRSRGEYPDLTDWMSGHVSRTRRLRKLLGERLLLRCCVPRLLRDGDVVEDFRAWFLEAAGRALPPASQRFRRNVGLSAQGCGLILETAYEARTAQDGARLRALIGEFDLTQADAVRLALPERFAKPIHADNAVGWNALVETLAHTEAEKATVRLTDAPAPGGPHPRSFDRWLRSRVTDDYRGAFRAYVAGHPSHRESRSAADRMNRSAAPEHGRG